MRRRLFFPAIGLMGVLMAATSARAATRHVPSEFATIQAGIDAAAAGDTVLVAPGVYSRYDTRATSSGELTACLFLKDGVVVLSSGGADATTIFMPVTALQPAIVWGQDLPSTTTSLEGFTITGIPLYSSAVHVTDVGEVTFEECVFRDLVGRATNAGLNVSGGDVDVIGCRFENCKTTGGSGLGAGIYHHDGRIEVRDSHFESCDERAIFLADEETDREAILEGCTFVSCRGSEGGALRIGARPAGATIRACDFIENVSYGSGGGAISISGPGPRLVEGCLFVSNETTGANGQGGALQSAAEVCNVRWSTFWGNHQARAGGGSAVAFLASGASGSTLENNIIAACAGSAAVQRSSNVTLVSTCNVFWQNEQGDEGEGYAMSSTDREVDPLFCEDNFTVMETSPCLAESSLGCGQIGAFAAGCGTVVAENVSNDEVVALPLLPAGIFRGRPCVVHRDALSSTKLGHSQAPTMQKSRYGSPVIAPTQPQSKVRAKPPAPSSGGVPGQLPQTVRSK